MPEVTPPEFECWPEVRRIYDAVDQQSRRIPSLTVIFTLEEFAGSVGLPIRVIQRLFHSDRPFPSSQRWEIEDVQNDFKKAGQEAEQPFDALAENGRSAQEALVAGGAHAEDAEAYYMSVAGEAQDTGASAIVESTNVLRGHLETADQMDRTMQERFENLWSAHKENMADSQEMVIALSGILEALKTIEPVERDARDKAGALTAAQAKLEPHITEMRKPTEALASALRKILWPSGRYQ